MSSDFLMTTTVQVITRPLVSSQNVYNLQRLFQSVLHNFARVFSVQILQLSKQVDLGAE